MSAGATVDDLIRRVPKAELHVHVEGTLEPELMFALAERNGIRLRFASADEVRRAYEFQDLQSFLDIYYESAAVLRREQDFYDMAAAYLRRAVADNVRRAEIFFDPQTHTARGVAFDTVVSGLYRATVEVGRETGISAALILCFLRHLPAGDAMETLRQALPFRDRIVAVGLDSSERGHPPSKFAAVFERARAEGLHTVAHAGEEGPPEYIREALSLLGASRIDHGVRCEEDPALVDELKGRRIPLTVCPLSNVKLRVVTSLRQHNLRRLLDQGLVVTVNSDDPAFFGGYVGDNYRATRQALDLSPAQIRQLARNSFEASFLDPQSKAQRLAEVDAVPS